MEGRQTPFKPIVPQHLVDTSNDDYVLTEDHATYLKLNHKYILPHPDVYFHSGNGIHRSSFKWNYKTREAAKQAERERLLANAKSETDRYWAELYCDYYEVLSEFSFRPGITPLEASHHIGRNVLKKSQRCIKVVGLMAGRWKTVLPNYLTRLDQLRRESSDRNLCTDDEDVKPELSDDDDDYGENEAGASAASSQKPGEPPRPGPSAAVHSRKVHVPTDEYSMFFERTLKLAAEAEKLLNRHSHAAEIDDVTTRRTNFVSSLKDAKELANGMIQPQSDEATGLLTALRNMELNCCGITTQCRVYSEISSAAVSLLEQLSEESQRLTNLCAWMLNNKDPIQEPGELSVSALSDDCEMVPSSSKKRRTDMRVEDVHDAQVPHTSDGADGVEEEASMRTVPSNESVENLSDAAERLQHNSIERKRTLDNEDKGSERSSTDQTSNAAGSDTRKVRKAKKKSRKADVEWDSPNDSVEIVLGWTNPGGSMRRLLDDQAISLREKGIIFLDGPQGAHDADEESRTKWYQARKDEFEAAIQPIVKAYKKNVISNMFCPYCRNRQREGNNASSAIRDHWKKYHARTHKG